MFIPSHILFIFSLINITIVIKFNYLLKKSKGKKALIKKE